MKDYIKMVAVLTLITAVCGFLLAAVHKGTEQRIVEQILTYVQGPAVNKVLATSTNDLIADRQEILIDDEPYLVFVGKKDAGSWAIAFESKGTGFGGDVGVMVGYDLEEDLLTGIGILTHSETPGLGARISETAFTDIFSDHSLTANFNVKQDDGMVDAISGATISSRAVCSAVRTSIKLYPKIKNEFLNQ